ncbi:MAG: PQQ-binding-like beta-propeller repeat protein [Myxococcales bacterium]|nr:PQQ-binding-like beta-propeller repeat protein [Myxococcales bacterium]
MTRWIVVLGLLAGACKSKSEAKQLCERAATRFEGCMRELLGSEGAAMARSAPDGLEACTKDDRTVAMYQRCLPSESCVAFIDCLQDTVREAGVKIDPSASREAQCTAHVDDGLRGIAMQVVLMNEIEKRARAAMRRVQDCVIDDTTPWNGCITAEERREVARYAVQRQTDCEAWDDKLAACVFGLPGAKDCDPDAEPTWRLPREQGIAGPKVAWSIEIDDPDDDLDDDVWTTWAPGGVLLVKDRGAVRAVKDGTVVWTADVQLKERMLALAGTTLYGVSRDSSELVALNIATGKWVAPLAGKSVEIVGAAGGKGLVETADSLLYEIDGAKVKKLGEIDEDDAIEPAWIGQYRDTIAMTNADQLLLVDRSAKTVFQISGGEDISDMVVAGDDLIAAQDTGLAILSIPECRKLGSSLELPSTKSDLDCIVARHTISSMMTVTPVAVPGRAVAFNDHGITSKTQLFGVGAKPWAVETDATGDVVGDDRLVYTVSFGPDNEGPVRLLALDRTNGAALWHTQLAAKPPESTDVTFAIKSDALAVRLGDRVFVIPLSRRT